MNLTPRATGASDAAICGQICYDAFGAIAARHNFPSDIPAPDLATGLAQMMLAHPNVWGLVAEVDGAVVGGNFLWKNG